MAVIIIGFVVMLTGALVALWASFQISSLERAQNFLDEMDDEWNDWLNPYPGLLGEEFERERSYYSNIRIVGVVTLIAGVVVVVVGAILLRKEPAPAAYAPMAPATITGAVNYCEYCGRHLSPGAVMCPGCGRTFPRKRHEVGPEQEVR